MDVYKYHLKEFLEIKERSTFEYWFAHWCAFQIIALLTKFWKPKNLLLSILDNWKEKKLLG